VKAEFERLRKEYATFALLVSELATQSHPDGFETPGVLEDEVGALLKYWRHEIGECTYCGARAPLSEGRCAWGASAIIRAQRVSASRRSPNAVRTQARRCSRRSVCHRDR
jgi:hypothetical protein